MKHRISALRGQGKGRSAGVKTTEHACMSLLRNVRNTIAAFFQSAALHMKTFFRTQATSKSSARIVQRTRMIALVALRAVAQCARLFEKAIRASLRKSLFFLRAILPHARKFCGAIRELFHRSLSYLCVFGCSIIPHIQAFEKAVRMLLQRTLSFLRVTRRFSTLRLSALKRSSKVAPRRHHGGAILQALYAHRGDVAYYALLILAVSALTLGATRYRSARNEPATQSEARSVGAISEGLPAAEETPEAPVLGQRPVPGEILQPFAPNELIWSEELGQWQTHPGVDFAGCAGEAVQAVFDGRVTQIYDDPLYGGTVVVDCGDHGTLRYSSLSTLRLVQKDQELKAGEILGAVGTCPAEESLGEHLHLEWYVSGEAVDPTTFIEQ